MIILRIVFFIILLLFSVVILGILKLFASLAIKILFGRLKENIKTSYTRQQQRWPHTNQEKQNELVLCAACSSYISASSALPVNHAGKKQMHGWVCKDYQRTGKTC